MPETVFNRVFEDLKRERPLLSAIDFVNTTAVTQWIHRAKDAEAAWWGILSSAIQKKLEGAFNVEAATLYKLSAYFPVPKAMLDLGPEWLDRFVREMLMESMALALETAIISGTGKDQPVGMMKDLDGAVVGGVYPDKTASALNDFKPLTLGEKIMAPLTNDGKRAVTDVLLIVNPIDYWEKIFPQTTMLSSSGQYVYGVLPIPANIIQSSVMPKGKLVAGMGKDYWMGVGSERKMEYSDDYKFLEDVRVYISKQYANGKPVGNKATHFMDKAMAEVDGRAEEVLDELMKLHGGT
jgi:hypothetical protein